MGNLITNIIKLLVLRYPTFFIGLSLCIWTLNNFIPFISALIRYPSDSYAIAQTEGQVFDSEMEKSKTLYHYRQEYLSLQNPDEIPQPAHWEYPQRDSMRYSFDCNTPFTLSLDEQARVFPHNSIPQAFFDEYHFFTQLQIDKNSKLIMKRLTDIGLSGDKVYQQKINGIPTITIQKFLSPELTPKLLSNQRDIVFLCTKDCNEIPRRVRDKIMKYIEYPGQAPHLLGYVSAPRSKRVIDSLAFHYMNILGKDAYLMWSFAKENVGAKDENGNDIYAYGLYYLGDNPNPNKTGLNLNPIQSVEVHYEYDTELPAANNPPHVKLQINEELAGEWNFFTLKEKQKYCAIVMDNEVLYTYYIPGSTEDLTIKVRENHQLNDLPYLYALLRNPPFQNGPPLFYEEESLTYRPLKFEEMKRYSVEFIIPAIIFTIYLYLIIRRKRKKATQRELH